MKPRDSNAFVKQVVNPEKVRFQFDNACLSEAY